MENSVQFVSTRVLVQNALSRYNNVGNNTEQNWTNAISDMQAALGGQGGAVGQTLLLQARVYPKNATGPNGPYPLINATSDNSEANIQLPWTYPNGTQVYLGDDDLGYPPALYPNLTYYSTDYNSSFRVARATFDGATLGPSSTTVMLGPWLVNSTFSLVSMTMPIINNTSAIDVLGWLTVVMDASLIGDVLTSPEGLDETGETLLFGPVNQTNRFPNGILYDSPTGVSSTAKDEQIRFVLPLSANESGRHPGHTVGTANPAFPMSKYAAVVEAVTKNQDSINNAGSDIATKNEDGQKVSVGFAMPNTKLCDWVVVLEQARSEVWQPINHLRNILLACVFGTAGGLLLIAFPLAHYGSRPIRRLRDATKQTVLPSGYTDSSDSLGSEFSGVHEVEDRDAEERNLAKKEGFLGSVAIWRRGRQRNREERQEHSRRRQFRIPGKVRDRKHVIRDELTDLTMTFNEMSDELMMQYERLEERVRQRTAELEISKKAAEAANESKTLFIANISHELKTPLNGILGMCAVCMQEDDPVRLKRSLGIIYKSGDLLLNLLTDLLTFSKNQVGQQLSLDEKEFRLRDISSQTMAIFDKQAKESQIDLKINFQGSHTSSGLGDQPQLDSMDSGPFGTGRVKDMVLWGDQHRILQVVINLVSNSLKFTPPGGKVTLSVRCLGEAPDFGSRKGSMQSKGSRQQSSRHKGSDASLAVPSSRRTDTANEINVHGRSTTYANFMASERAPSPPPGRSLMFEFEIEDTGPGIPENLQQRIFEPFVQGDLGLSKKYGGTGLGLSICSQLATLMRGTIHLDSEVGRGSTFTMRIPLRHLLSRADSTASSTADLALRSQRPSMEDPKTPGRRSRGDTDAESRASVSTSHSAPIMAPPAAPAPEASPHRYEADSQPRLIGLSQPFFASSQPMESPGSQPGAMEKIAADASSTGKIRVLVAEDNKVNQEVVLRMLKLEDIYDVTVAKDGQEALDLVKQSMDDPHTHPPYNLIFMDVQMPNLDGLQSTRLIREIGYNAPIVALTAFAEESNVKDCLDSGMNYFLSKPIRRPALKKVLKEYCAPIVEENEEEMAAANKAPVDDADETISPGTVMERKPNESGGPMERQLAHDAAIASLAAGTNTTVVVTNSRPSSARNSLEKR